MKNPRNKLLQDVSSYYSEKLATYGDTPRGVDWNEEHGQLLRFKLLCKILKVEKGFSITDLGCGYGKLYSYLCENYSDFKYTGYDISSDMVNAAQKKHPGANFIHSSNIRSTSDYSVASGIFNVKMGHTDNEWKTYILDTLKSLNDASTEGFAFNCLTSYSDPDYMRPDLFYTDPLYVFDYCKKNFAKNVSLLHDYDLYEFTILVFKDHE